MDNDFLRNVSHLLCEAFVKFEDKPDQFYKCYMDGVTDMLNLVVERDHTEDQTRLNAEPPKDAGITFFEPLSGRYFDMSLEKFDQAVREVLRQSRTCPNITVNEWFDTLGLEPQLVFGDAYYWLNIPDPFLNTTTEVINGKPVCVIHYMERPTNAPAIV